MQLLSSKRTVKAQVLLVSVKSSFGDAVNLCQKVCAPFFSVCLSYMDIREVLCKRLQGPKLRDCIEEGRKNYIAGTTTEWIPESVAKADDVNVASILRATALNAEEFEQCLGKKPLAKNARYIPTCTALGLNKVGEVVQEQVFLFRWDPLCAYRTIEIRLGQTVSKIQTIVAPGSMAFAKQGTMAYNHFTKEQSGQFGMPMVKVFRSIEEVKIKMGKSPEDFASPASVGTPPRQPSAHRQAHDSESYADTGSAESAMQCEEALGVSTEIPSFKCLFNTNEGDEEPQSSPPRLLSSCPQAQASQLSKWTT